MKEIYRFRTTDQLLKCRELEDQAIYFASPAQLNDPIERLRNLVWRGDHIVWTNIFRHYLQCLQDAYGQVVIMAGESEFTAEDIAINRRWDDPPSGQYAHIGREIWQEVSERFGLTDLALMLERLDRRVRGEELGSYLYCFHLDALAIIQRTYMCYGLIEPPTTPLRFSERMPGVLRGYIDVLGQLTDDEEFVQASFRISSQILDHIRLIPRLVTLRRDTDQAEQNWSFLAVDFPKAYVQQLARAIGPERYVACFTADYRNSTMWANYAAGHTGVCLIFVPNCTEHGYVLPLYELPESEESDPVRVRQRGQARPIGFDRVRYQAHLEEVEFFRRISMLPEASARATWYTDDGRMSSVADHMTAGTDISRWRDELWSEYRRDACVKTEEWAYEQEYRLIQYSLLAERLPSSKRRFTYDFECLKGIIFGIDTSDTAKVGIIESVRRKCLAANRKDFEFRQAYYSHGLTGIDTFPLSLRLS